MKTQCLTAFLLGVFLTLMDCATTPIGFRPDPSGDFVHIHSGMRFPRTVGRLDRLTTDMFDGAGFDIGVGYGSSPPTKVVMSVYVYPSEKADLEEGFEKVKKDVEAAHPDAVRVTESGTEHHQGGTTTEGKTATYAFQGDGEELISRACLFAHGPWFILYRATYERLHQAEAAREVEVFMDLLSWPDL